MLVDSHCHLDYPDFADELDDVIARAHDAGVGRMVTIGTRLEDFPRVLAVAQRFDGVHCTVGVHPHETAGQGGSVDAQTLIALADHPKVVGIGETGLDYYYDHSPRADQRQSFRTHIAAARETGLPLVVHSRDADDDMAAILREEMAAGPFSGVMHCFSSSRQLADEAIELGMYVSLSGIVTFKKADDLRAIAADLPLDRLLVETDAPFLAPVPHRGRRNEPSFVTHTAAQVAAVKGLELSDIESATTDNFFTLFHAAQR